MHRLQDAYRAQGHNTQDRAQKLESAMNELSIDWSLTGPSSSSSSSSSSFSDAYDVDMDANRNASSPPPPNSNDDPSDPSNGGGAADTSRSLRNENASAATNTAAASSHSAVQAASLPTSSADSGSAESSSPTSASSASSGSPAEPARPAVPKLSGRGADAVNERFVVDLLNYLARADAATAALPSIGDFLRILAQARRLLSPLPNVVRVPPECQRAIVVGDLHGQLDDLLTILAQTGLPQWPRNVLIFNGDFVDRGPHSCEVLLVLLALKCWRPDAVYLNRGNHEARDLNGRDGFEAECLRKYNAVVFDACQHVFVALPLACVLRRRVLVVHGFVWPIERYALAQVEALDRFHAQPPEGSLMELILWSDPSPTDAGITFNPRGAGLCLGADVTERFLAATGFELIVRSHECVREGFEHAHGQRVVTVFSGAHSAYS